MTQAPTLYVHTIVIEGTSTKVLLASFFHWLPFCPPKICLLVPIHTLDPVMKVLGLYLVFIASPKVHNIGSQTCMGIIPSFLRRRWMEPRAVKEKKVASNPFVLPAITPCLYAHILLRVMEVLMNIIKSFILTF